MTSQQTNNMNTYYTVKYKDTNNNRHNRIDYFEETENVKIHLSFLVCKMYAYNNYHTDQAIIDECDILINSVTDLTEDELQEGFSANYDGKYIELTTTITNQHHER